MLRVATLAALLAAGLVAAPANAANDVLSVTYTAEDPGSEVNEAYSYAWSRFVSTAGRRVRALDRAYARACGFNECAWFSFSRDGRRVVAGGRTEEGDNALFLGSFPRARRLRVVPLPPRTSSVSDPTFGPGGLVAFAGYRRGPGADQKWVWTVDHSGKRLTSIAAGVEPAWSPYGALAFSSPRGLFVRYKAGSRPLRIRRRGGSPAWSPDGSRIAFSDQGDIVVMSAGGIGLRRLTSGKARDVDPVWSPDGRQVAFVRKRLGAYDQIERVSADGGIAVPIVSEQAFKEVLDFEPTSSGLRLHDWHACP